MTGPRTPTLFPQSRRARHLLPFLLAIVASPIACTNDAPTGPADIETGPSTTATRTHPYLASRAGQSGTASSMRVALSRAQMRTAAAILPSRSAKRCLISSFTAVIFALSG